eukprot:Skav233237  [mRNA]  locus=scaffold2149:86542:87919:- [translate_table: standard]
MVKIPTPTGRDSQLEYHGGGQLEYQSLLEYCSLNVHKKGEAYSDRAGAATPGGATATSEAATAAEDKAGFVGRMGHW